jgi:hypothetical protein
MVLTPIRRLITNDKKKQRKWDDNTSEATEPAPAPLASDLLPFTTVDHVEYILIEADITGVKLKNVHVEWNYSKIYVGGEVNGTLFKQKFKMPKGAKKSKIEGHLLREDGRFFIKVPMKPGHSTSPRKLSSSLLTPTTQHFEFDDQTEHNFI